MTHTPGPWYPELRRIHTHASECNVWCVNKGPGLGSIADGLSEANARLIAAAPDLLEACVSALHALNHGTQVEETLQELDAAIARATGQDHA